MTPPTQIGLSDALFWRKNNFWHEQTIFWLIKQCHQLKTLSKLLWWKSGLRSRRKKQLSAWSVININNFEGKTKTMYLLFISWIFDQYNLSYSTLKSFVLVDFLWISNLENKSKEVNQYLSFWIYMSEPKKEVKCESQKVCV